MKDNKMGKVTNYYLNEFISDIAYSSYAITFMEVLANSIQQESNQRGGREIIGVDKDVLQALKNQVVGFKSLLGVSEDDKSIDYNEQENIRRIQYNRQRFEKQNEKSAKEAVKGMFKRPEVKTLTKQQNDKLKEDIESYKNNYTKTLSQLKIANYGVLPLSKSYAQYLTLIKYIRNKPGKFFDVSIYDVTNNIQTKFFFNSGADRLSTSISPDWIIPYRIENNTSMSGTIDPAQRWKYRKDQALELIAQHVPFNNFRSGWKRVVISKKEFIEYAKKITPVVAGGAGEFSFEAFAGKNILATPIVNPTALNTYLESLFTNAWNPAHLDNKNPSPSNIALYLRFPITTLSQVPLDDLKNLLVTHVRPAGSNRNVEFEITSNNFYPILNVNANDDAYKENYKNVFPSIFEPANNNQIKPLAGAFVGEEVENLFRDIDEFVKDYKEYKVKEIAENINLLIPEKNIPLPTADEKSVKVDLICIEKSVPYELYESARFAKEMTLTEMELVENGINDPKFQTMIERFKKAMENANFT